jgi:aspartate/methionine/tyrosine aminotransferase
VTPGIDFGDAAEGYLRFCYAVAPEVIESALSRLAPVLDDLTAHAGATRTSAHGTAL